MAVRIHNSNGYMGLTVWVMNNVIQLATESFCDRFLNLQNDPCGRQRDQMVQAARSAVANIAEGSSRRAVLGMQPMAQDRLPRQIALQKK